MATDSQNAVQLPQRNWSSVLVVGVPTFAGTREASLYGRDIKMVPTTSLPGTLYRAERDQRVLRLRWDGPRLVFFLSQDNKIKRSSSQYQLKISAVFWFGAQIHI